MSRFFPGHHAAWFLGLLLFWFALSGAWDLQHLLLGAAVAAAALALRWRVAPHQPSQQVSGVRRRRPGGFAAPLQVAGYLFYLLQEVIKANIQVAMIVLNPKLPVSPAFISYHPGLRTDWARVLLANSITLTPGTLTVELEDETLLVHALTLSAAQALPGWAAEKRMHQIEMVFGEADASV